MGRPPSSHLPKLSLTPLVHADPTPASAHTHTHTNILFHTGDHALLLVTQSPIATWVRVIKGSRHLDIVEGDRERSQRREGSGSSTSQTFQVSPEEAGGGKKEVL